MPRRERLDFRGAVHFVQIRGANGREIFLTRESLAGEPRGLRQHAPHAVEFERLIGETCAETAASLHAYSLEPNSCALVLRTGGASLSGIMQRLCGRYSRYLRSATSVEKGRVFSSRYQSRVVAPEYLPHAVRRTHRGIIDSGLWTRPSPYPLSSDVTYRGESAPIPVDTCDVRSSLETRHFDGPEGYRRYMAMDESPYVDALFKHGSPLDARIVGGKVFVQRCLYLAAHPAPPPSRDVLIATIARLIGARIEDLHEPTHTAVLGRALVAWHGLRTGAATLQEMGRWFSVSGAALGQAIERHRVLRPELFNRREVI